MEGLPFLPGYTFHDKDPTKTRYHVHQTLDYKNGYMKPVVPVSVGKGGEPIHFNQISQNELDELAKFQPTLTYGQAKQAPPEDFVPAHKYFDKKVLRFYGYFKETVHESPQEHFRVRPVEVYYFLEDDAILVNEPAVDNSGIPQGKLINRHRIPKNDHGDCWHWKDLNVGVDVVFYGKVFRLCDADKFTKDFLESEGIAVNPAEPVAEDPYTQRRVESLKPKYTTTPSSFDKLRQFIEMDRKVLRFWAVWDDTNSMFGEMRPHLIQYYLVDDTMEVREIHEQNDGRDPFPVLIGRHKVPKDRDALPPAFPLIAMEISDKEVKDYFKPHDLGIGKTVEVYGRRFLLYDCDQFTKAFYYDNFGITDFTPIDWRPKKSDLPKMEIPPYNGFGTIEDSLQSCQSYLEPRPPKKDYIKILENDHKILRYAAELDSVVPEDKGRKFIISYRLADDMIYVYEPPIRNSGFKGGRFLERTRPAKPESTPENPVFYGPQDFKLGAIIKIFGQRFRILDADEYVLKFAEEHADQFPGDTLDSLRTGVTKTVDERCKEPVKGGAMQVKRGDGGGELSGLVREMTQQLKKMRIIDSQQMREMFLTYDCDRSGYIELDELKRMCRKINLPIDEDVIEALAAECGADSNGRIAFHDFLNFFEA